METKHEHVQLAFRSFGHDNSTAIGLAADGAFAANPINGIPMIGGIGGVDIRGNPWGTDFVSGHLSAGEVDSFAINPANGLPMIDGIGSVDVMGNPYGMDYSDDAYSSTMHDDAFSSCGGFDSCFDCSSATAFDDSFSSSSSFDSGSDWTSGSCGGLSDG